MVAKVKTTVSIRKDLKKAAQEFELNLSELLENAIIQRIKELRYVEAALELKKHAGGGIRTHACHAAHGLSRPAQCLSATPAWQSFMAVFSEFF